MGIGSVLRKCRETAGGMQGNEADCDREIETLIWGPK